MLARLSIVITLIVSLLFVTHARPVLLPVEMKQGGMCAGMECARGCCANMACCDKMEQQKAPQTPAPAPQQNEVLVATIDLRAYTVLFIPPAPRCPFVILDEASTRHTLSPRAVSCIILI
jgi:hypothetical protein